MRHLSRRLSSTAWLLGATLAAACGVSTRRLGRNPAIPDTSIEVRNNTDVGLNMYKATGVALHEVFLGQVGPRRSERVKIPDAAPGDTVWLRARPIDGRPQYVRDDIVVGRHVVWKIP